MLFEVLLVMVWFVALTLPAGFGIIAIVKTVWKNKILTTPFMDCLLSVIVGMTYVALAGDILSTVFRSLSVSNYFLSIVFVWTLLLFLRYKNRQENDHTFHDGLMKLPSAARQSLIYVGKQFNKRRLYFLGLILLLLFTVVLRSKPLLTGPMLVASDPWYLMGLGNYGAYSGFIPLEFVYVGSPGIYYFLALMYSCGIDPLLITIVIQPIMLQPLTFLLLASFVEGLRFRDSHKLLILLLYSSSSLLLYENEVVLPRNIGYLFAIAVISLWSYKRGSTSSAILLGFLFGGIWYYHIPSAIPLVVILAAELIVALGKSITFRKRTENNLPILVLTVISALLVLSPVISRMILFSSSLSRYYTYDLQPASIGSIEQSIGGGVLSVLRNGLYDLEKLSIGFMPFGLAMIALPILYSDRQCRGRLRYVVYYFLILLFLGFNPYTSLIPGLQVYQRYFASITFPISILCVYVLDRAAKYELEARRSPQVKGLRLEIGCHKVISILVLLLLSSSVISVNLYSYPQMYYKDPHATDSLLNALYYVKLNTEPSPNIKILTYPYGGEKGDIYTTAFGILSPRSIIGDEIVFMNLGSLRDFVKTEKIAYIILMSEDINASEPSADGFDFQVSGEYVVLWLIS